MDFSDQLRSGFRFASDTRRVALWAFVHLAFLVAAVLPLGLLYATTDISKLLSLQGIFAAIGLVIFWGLELIAFVLVEKFLVGMFIHAAGQHALGLGVSLRQSASAAWSRYPVLLAATVIIAVLGYVLGSPARLFGMLGLHALSNTYGVLSAILLGLVFMFVEYEVVSGRKSTFDSIKSSYALLVGNASEVIFAAIVSMCIAVIVGVVLLFITIPTALLLIGLVSSGGPVQLAFATLVAVVAGVLSLSIIAFSRLFCIGFLATVYSGFYPTPKLPQQKSRRRR